MPESEDILSRDVVIAAKLEENGIALRTQSRAVAALDRLVGSLFDIPAAFSEGVARKKRFRDSVNERILLKQAEIAERKLSGIPDAGDALLFDILKDAGRKQINAAGVAIEAIDTLKLPPPDATSTGPSEEPDVEIDCDWMNQFVRYAEDASTEQLQQLWGRVLAGEMRRVGSFSRQTLRFIAELDRETAENCEYAAERAVDDFIPKTKEWNGGEGLIIGLDLQRLGLVEGVGGLGPQRTFKLDHLGQLLLEHRQKALLVSGKPGTEIQQEIILLTRTGKEVFALLAPKSAVVGLRAVAETAEKKDGVTKVELGFHVKASAVEGRFFTEQTLWEAPEAA